MGVTTCPTGSRQASSGSHADVQANDLEWFEVAEGSYFKALTVHEPTNTVAFAFQHGPGRPPTSRRTSTSAGRMAFTTKGWFGCREGTNRVANGMFSYEAAGLVPHAVLRLARRASSRAGIFEGDTARAAAEPRGAGSRRARSSAS